MTLDEPPAGLGAAQPGSSGADPSGVGSSGVGSSGAAPSGVVDPAGPRPTHPSWRPGGPPSTEPRPEIGETRDGTKRLGLVELLVAVVVYLGGSLGVGLVLSVLSPGGIGPIPSLLLAAVAAFLAVGLTMLVRTRSAAAVGMRRVALRWLAVAVGVGVGSWLLSRVVILVYIAVTGDLRNSQQEITDLALGTGVQVAVLLVMAVIVAPVGEELLFRGVAFGSLRRYGVVLATLVSAVLFSLAHGLGAVTVGVFVLAVANAVLYDRSRSIWPCMIAHGTFNLISLGLALLVLR